MSEPKKKVLTEGQLRGVLRGMIREYVANDEGNPHKDVHADPSGRNWDTGLDDLDEAMGPQTPPPVSDDDPPMEMNLEMDESEEEHSETHGGKKVGDPRWDSHSEPTARNWDTGLD